MPDALLADTSLSILTRVLHTTCGATLLGGTVYLRFVLAPAAQGADDVAGVCFAGRRAAWSMCVAACSGLLILSGLYNLMMTIMLNEKLPPAYHMTFGVKFLLAFVVFALAAMLAGKTSLAERLRGSLTLWLNVLLAATLAIFVLGAVLRSIDKVPKADPDEARSTAVIERVDC